MIVEWLANVVTLLVEMIRSRRNRQNQRPPIRRIDRNE